MNLNILIKRLLKGEAYKGISSYVTHSKERKYLPSCLVNNITRPFVSEEQRQLLDVKNCFYL